MAESQPPTIVEGATTGDVEDEVPVAKSAEDRKAAAALSSLDVSREDEATGVNVDQEAVRKAMDRLAGAGAANGTVAKKGDEKKVVKKIVKVDQADVALLVEELELSKIKATDLLKLHDGNAGKALRAYITPVA
ncbi:hypothetical protein G7Y89_g15035 [Cudoniella acicularis]|uniref:Nascent polypeptide-associated complex subunit alpha-like UBA domain-containing protein n=1 Tax=Cudoniella acicularis TaxID=354080 RepID=A0A8H4QW90_9HELO|nr:hypothetical protein G7Y89_g15035 [Cudoniella acicularis]